MAGNENLMQPSAIQSSTVVAHGFSDTETWKGLLPVAAEAIRWKKENNKEKGARKKRGKTPSLFLGLNSDA
ncbi:hypothetical protein CEXT_308671 [Caerostris extrusa]|uniref:Uncharacterized protein n=1 Tax=Caerostris extrusa TaxID=172846 RepID=A0AAV4XL52_CAEEX|nr:hypothetical protein CEXT_308671 [Caerostris extrusa]